MLRVSREVSSNQRNSRWLSEEVMVIAPAAVPAAMSVTASAALELVAVVIVVEEVVVSDVNVKNLECGLGSRPCTPLETPATSVAPANAITAVKVRS